MNIFERAAYLEHLRNLPKEYIVSKKDKIVIKVKYITEFWFDGLTYVDNIYNSDFEERIDFEEFLFKNFKYVNKIFTNKNIQEEFILENGLLSNKKSWAYLKDGIPNYYINGRNYTEEYFKNKLRMSKFERIL
jgi:hypothetical protein